MQVDYQLASGPRLFGVENGQIVQPGSGPVVTLAGGHVVPAFTDCHCHILPTGLDLHKLDLSGCTSHEEVAEKVLQRHREQPDGWLHAVHYDQNRFPGGQHMTCKELDAVVADRPVLLRHVNGHAGVANSAALVAAGIAGDTPDPSGGTYRRGDDGRHDGVLLERAMEIVTNAAPEPSLEEMTAAIVSAGHAMSRFGVCSATDMMTGRWNLEKELMAYQAASEAGCPVRLRLFLQWGTVFGRQAIDAGRLNELSSAMRPDVCRIEGAKIFADGAIGSATAAIHGAFLTGGSGHLIYPPDRLSSMVHTADKAGWRIAIHAIGDRAVDHVMDAFEATDAPARHRLEHAMILSDGQIDRIAKSGVHVSMQPEFLYRFGHAYRAQLPAEVAAKLNRARSLLGAGVPMSFSSDRPIVLGDPLVGIRSAVARPKGFDPAEAVPWVVANRLYTSGAATANGDDGQGTLGVGKWADFAVFDKAPEDGGTVHTLFVGGRQVYG
ncbi:MAG: amidohydrolase [Armatimonadetes bacterium]|nr:amidohydrolase [Armatimonadota bacterium]